jgi:riboflavin synthase
VQVAIIPHTWSHTNLGRLQPGDAVNVEGDLLGKYVGRILATRLAGGNGA